VDTSAFQKTFRVKMHANNVFSFFKNYFWHQHIKTIQNIQTILNFNKKKILNFLKTQSQPRFQTIPTYPYKTFVEILPCRLNLFPRGREMTVNRIKDLIIR
jgi:hypothetical protein